MSGNDSKGFYKNLVGKAQNGDAEALGVLKDSYLPLLRGAVLKYSTDSMSDQDKEELFGEALIAFCNAVLSYDLSFAGIEFGLYAKICIEYALTSYLRAFERRSRLVSVPLEELDASKDFRIGGDLFDVVIARENAADLTRRISSLLSNYENSVWWMYVSGLSVKDIAHKVGADEKSVHNAVYRIRRKLRGVISEK